MNEKGKKISNKVSDEINNTSLGIFLAIVWLAPFNPDQIVDILERKRKWKN